jgi:hypothetical protein
MIFSQIILFEIIWSNNLGVCGDNSLIKLFSLILVLIFNKNKVYLSKSGSLQV